MDFMKIQIIDIVDILLVALLIYQVYRLVRRTNALSIFAGILMIYLLWLAVRELDMTLLSAILRQVVNVGVIALLIVFQPEIRKSLFLLGERYGRRNRIFRKLFFPTEIRRQDRWMEEIVSACERMARSQTGALIVIRRNSELDSYTAQGVVIDAEISAALLENIFFKNSPLHDGAVVIEGGRIRAARCILPVSERTNIPSHYGTRHRAALGVSEVTDAVVLVVSEERGQISLVTDGRIVGNVGRERLQELLAEAFTEEK
jgi:uncharacterized protein (TIGR00159 family)